MIKISRGSALLKIVDKVIGKTLIYILSFIKFFRTLYTVKRCEKSEISCLAVCCYGAIGDLLLISEALDNEKRNNPKTKIFLFCTSSNKSCSDLYPHLYDAVYDISLTSINPFKKYIKQEGIQKIIDFNQWANISVIHCLASKISNPSIFLKGFSRKGERYYDEVLLHSDSVHEFINYNNLISDRKLLNNNLPDLIPRLFNWEEKKKSKKNVLIHMWPSGTRSYLKEWPEKYWIDLCEYLMGDGYTIYLSGSPADMPRNKAFSNKLKLSGFIDISGSKSLVELSDFMVSDISFCVSVNTGILHLAYLSNIPVIGLHGPTNPTRWGTIGSRSISLLPEKGNFAYLNYGFEYPKEDKDAYALQYLHVMQVREAVKKIESIILNSDNKCDTAN